MRRLAAFLLLLAATSRADAPPMSLAERVAASDLVVVGEVTGLLYHQDAPGIDHSSVVLQPERALLGAADGDLSILCLERETSDAMRKRSKAGLGRVIVFAQQAPTGLVLLTGNGAVEDWSEALEKEMEPLIRAAQEARAIEGLARYESSGIGYAGAPGEAYTRLDRILALKDDAAPFLRRLAVAKNPVARIVAVVGCTVAPSEDRLRVVLALLADDEEADCIEGCLVGKRRVREYAKDALARYPDNQRIEGLIRVLEGAETGSKDAARAALVDITKQELGDDAAKWRAWWNEKRSK